MATRARNTVLVADDDPLVRRMLETWLRTHGYAVLSAGSGREALTVLRGGAGVDLVLTDILMPDVEGIELIRTLRQEFPGLHILAMSGGGRYLERDFLDEATLFGADGVLKKPFALDDLERSIVAVCGVA